MTNPSPPPPRPGVSGRWLWLILAVGLLWMQWPTVKGLFYRWNDRGGAPAGIQWQKDFPTAAEESRRTGRPILLDFQASWCPPCQVMKHESWPNAEVAQIANARFIPLQVDVDSLEGRRLADQYDIRAVPTIVVTDSAGKVIDRRNFMKAAELAQFLGSSAAAGAATAPTTQP